MTPVRRVLLRFETVQLVVWRQLAALLTFRARGAAMYVGDGEDVAGRGAVAHDDLRELKLRAKIASCTRAVNPRMAKLNATARTPSRDRMIDRSTRP